MSDTPSNTPTSHIDHQQQPEEKYTGWYPIRHHRIYLAFWIASIVTNIGASMHDTGASWLMATLTPSPLLVALVQTVASLAVVLFIVPSGAFATVFERRKLLLFIQGWMLVTATVTGVLALLDIINPSLLLVLTFILGIGTAMNMPTAIVSAVEMTSRQEAQGVITLGSVAINIGRAVGPIVGGIIIATIGGPGAVFLINAVTFAVMMTVIYRWHREIPKTTLPTEHVIEAIRTGIKYVLYAPQAQSMFVRGSAFAIFGSVIAAILPVLVERELGLNSIAFGLLLGFLGIGAVIGGTLLLPRIRHRTSFEKIVTGSTVLLAATMLTLAFVRDFAFLSVAMTAGGVGWILVISSLHFSMFKSLPKWVGARGLSVYLLIFQGSTALGSIIWGSVGDAFGVHYAFLFAAIGILAALLTRLKFRLTADLEVEKAPSKHWPEPTIMTGEPNPEDGPVLVKIEYRIDSKNLFEFTSAVKELSRIRKRDGALYWGLYRDDQDPNLFIESFTVASWAEHMRQHERITVEDKEIQDRVNAFHIGDSPPKASHFIAEPLPKLYQKKIERGTIKDNITYQKEAKEESKGNEGKRK
jgi:MFS family permease